MINGVGHITRLDRGKPRFVVLEMKYFDELAEALFKLGQLGLAEFLQGGIELALGGEGALRRISLPRSVT